MPEYVSNDEYQIVRLGGIKSDGSPDIADVKFEFPVPHRQMRIEQKVRIIEKDAKGRSGTIKQARGYHDAVINIHLSLVDQYDPDAGRVTVTARDQLKLIQSAFRDVSDEHATPTVFSIQSPLTDACGIRTVLFSEFPVSDTESSDQIDMDVVLIEFEPIHDSRSRIKNKPFVEPPEYVDPNLLMSLEDPSDAMSMDADTMADKHAEESAKEKAFRDGKAAGNDLMPLSPRS